MKKPNLFDIIVNIVIFLLTALAIYWIVQLLIGSSPELSQVNFALIILLATILIKLYREIGETKVEVKHISTSIRQSFNNIKEDMESIKKKLNIH